MSIAPAHLDRQFLCHIVANLLELVHESSTNPNSLREWNFSPSLLCFRRSFDRSTELIRGWISARDVRLLRVRDYGRLRLAHCGRSGDQEKVARALVGEEKSNTLAYKARQATKEPKNQRNQERIQRISGATWSVFGHQSFSSRSSASPTGVGSAVVVAPSSVGADASCTFCTLGCDIPGWPYAP